MRITTKMMTQSLMNNINNNLGRLQEYENQLSSNKKVNRPSDDPIATAQLLHAKSELNSQQQYSTNMSYASSYQTTVNDALSSAYDILESARDSAVSGSTGTTTQESMKALGSKIDGLIGEMVQVANTDFNGTYVFAGGETSAAPFTLIQDSSGNDTGVQFISDSYNAGSLDQTYSQKIEIASGVTIDLAAGKATFHTDSSGNTALNAVFTALITLKNNLNSGSTSAVGESLDAIDGLITNVTNEQAVGGAKSNRIESAQSRAENYTGNLTALISTLEDADYAQATTDYSNQKATYEASLSVGAKIIQPSLLDFLK